MDVSGSLNSVQAILLLVVVIALLWVAITTLFKQTKRGDMAGSFSVVGAAMGPIILIVIAIGGLATAVGTGLLKSIGIG